MPGKGFELEKVLNYRVEMEKMQRYELAVVMNAFTGAAEILRNDEDSLARLSTEFIHRQSHGINAADLHLYSNFCRKKSSDILRQRNEVESLEMKVEAQRQNLIEASTEKKELEMFKEKRLRQQSQEMAKREQGRIDEMAIRKRVAGE